MNAPKSRFFLRSALVGAALFLLTPTEGWTAPSDARQTGLGADIFKQQCSMCHSPERGQNLVGPSLFSVMGRPAASVGDFSYSSAMKNSGVTWTSDKLLTYLKAPRKYIPGAKMMFPGLPDEKDRENLVAFLATLGATNAEANGTAVQAKVNGSND